MNIPKIFKFWNFISHQTLLSHIPIIRLCVKKHGGSLYLIGYLIQKGQFITLDFLYNRNSEDELQKDGVTGMAELLYKDIVFLYKRINLLFYCNIRNHTL